MRENGGTYQFLLKQGNHLKALHFFLHQITSGAANPKYQRHLYTAKPDEMHGKRCSSLSEKEIRGELG